MKRISKTSTITTVAPTEKKEKKPKSKPITTINPIKNTETNAIKITNENNPITTNTFIKPSHNVVLELPFSLREFHEYLHQINKNNPLEYNPDIVTEEIASYNFDVQMGSKYEQDIETVNIKPIEQSNDGDGDCEYEYSIPKIIEKIKQIKIQFYQNNLPCEKCSACFWCSYDFPTPACYIPKYETSDMIYGYGTFCRPECAVAYLFNESLDDTTKMDRYSIINRIYGGIFHSSRNIKPAPNPHFLLQKYYGTLSIEEYRALLDSSYTINVLHKPMTRLLPELHDGTTSTNSGVGGTVGTGGTVNYKIKRESERVKGPTKNSIIKEKFSGSLPLPVKV